jgi:hypothetical protein
MVSYITDRLLGHACTDVLFPYFDFWVNGLDEVCMQENKKN